MATTALLAGVSALVLAAGGPVVVIEAGVEPYRVAAAAAEQRLAGARELDPADPELADKLKDATVVLAVGRKALKAAREHVAGKPVVFCMVLGVNRVDLSGTVTGVPLEADPAQVLTRIREVAPKVKKVGMVYSPAQSGYYLERARAAATAQGVTLVLAPVTDAGAARDAVDAMVGKIHALWLPPDPKLFSQELSAYVLGQAAENKLPLFGFGEGLTAEGALGAVSPDFADVGDRAGKLAAAIAAKPEGQRIPVPPPEYAPGALSLNLRSAGALGIDVPAEVVGRAGAHVVR
jgi:putative ABC transport system substrate-binding protein